MLFTECQNSTPFGSYRWSKFEILVGFLIDFDKKSQFWRISLKTYQIWQRLLKLAEIWTTCPLNDSKELGVLIFENFQNWRFRANLTPKNHEKCYFCTFKMAENRQIWKFSKIETRSSLQSYRGHMVQISANLSNCCHIWYVFSEILQNCDFLSKFMRNPTKISNFDQR